MTIKPLNGNVDKWRKPLSIYNAYVHRNVMRQLFAWQLCGYLGPGTAAANDTLIEASKLDDVVVRNLLAGVLAR